MMTREGTVKLIDFGIATQSGTRDRSLTGKPSYMAPEMVLEQRADHRSDVFSLGAVLYEMFTGERLFTGRSTADILEQVVAGRDPSPRAANPGVADEAIAILRKALQREPARRFASAGEMGSACEHFLYDKGYGPTNLTLKHYLNSLLPGAGAPAVPAPQEFPVIEATLISIGGEADQDTAIQPLPRNYTAPVTRPASARGGLTRRRIKAPRAK
jgi:serine/threonine-protein kinase